MSLTSIINDYILSHDKEISKVSKEQLSNSVPFVLPGESECTSLLESLRSDLELSPRSEESSHVYRELLKPSHVFAERTSLLWGSRFTENTEFLTEIQQIVEEWSSIEESSLSFSSPDFNKIEDLWKDLREEDDYFLQKYEYMDWGFLLHLNESETFMQFYSLMQMSAPFLNLITPFMIFFIPFLILQMRGVEMSFDNYVEIFKEIAKEHIFGKILSVKEFDMKTFIYISGSLFMFAVSTYQNILACYRHYQCIQYINDSLCEMRDFVDFSSRRMRAFSDCHRSKKTHRVFCDTLNRHHAVLSDVRRELAFVTPFSIDTERITSLGRMMRVFYLLHYRTEWADSIEYVLYFEGYIDNLRGLHQRVKDGLLQPVIFLSQEENNKKEGRREKRKEGRREKGEEEGEEERREKGEEERREKGEEERREKGGGEEERREEKEEKCSIFKDMFYPMLIDKNPVRNDVSLESNMILTGPNASGKTTTLKSVALNVLLSQQMGFGCFASGSALSTYSKVHSYINIPDTSERDSLFQAESRRCKDILDATEGGRHLCIFDELYSGTNYKEAVLAATAFLRYLSRNRHVDWLLTTHYSALCELLGEKERVKNSLMEVTVSSENGQLQYLYKLSSGVSQIQGAAQVLRDLQYPKEILDSFSTMDPPKEPIVGCLLSDAQYI